MKTVKMGHVSIETDEALLLKSFSVWGNLACMKHRWSLSTFGPSSSKRLAGILDHMAKEIAETAQDPLDAREWADLTILALDGFMRCVEYVHGVKNADTPAGAGEVWHGAFKILREKMAKNMLRDWPDWRTADPEKAIEHVRTESEAVSKSKELEAKPDNRLAELQALNDNLRRGRDTLIEVNQSLQARLTKLEGSVERFSIGLGLSNEGDAIDHPTFLADLAQMYQAKDLALRAIDRAVGSPTLICKLGYKFPGESWDEKLAEHVKVHIEGLQEKLKEIPAMEKALAWCGDLSLRNTQDSLDRAKQQIDEAGLGKYAEQTGRIAQALTREIRLIRMVRDAHNKLKNAGFTGEETSLLMMSDPNTYDEFMQAIDRAIKATEGKNDKRLLEDVENLKKCLEAEKSYAKNPIMDMNNLMEPSEEECIRLMLGGDPVISFIPASLNKQDRIRHAQNAKQWLASIRAIGTLFRSLGI